MHERQRWQLILRLVNERAAVSARELAAMTGASAATLRRDLTRLAERGLVRRTHGGVQAAAGVQASGHRATGLESASFCISQTLHGERKRAIARHAAALCTDGESIIINGGSTTFHMVEFLHASRLQILTNSFPIAEALVHHSGNRIIVPGGEIYREQNIILSPFDQDTIQHYTASKMFMSAMSIGPLGLVESDPLIARAEVKLLSRASELIVLADSSKFQPRGSIAVAPLSRISRLVTDSAAPADSLEMLRQAGVDVDIVPV